LREQQIDEMDIDIARRMRYLDIVCFDCMFPFSFL
jgi:hypothetical protein